MWLSPWRTTGPGIEAKNLQRIFDMFFSTKPGQLGLGLWVNRWIVEAEGGEIAARVGAAATTSIRFNLPADQPTTQR